MKFTSAGARRVANHDGSRVRIGRVACPVPGRWCWSKANPAFTWSCRSPPSPVVVICQRLRFGAWPDPLKPIDILALAVRAVAEFVSDTRDFSSKNGVIPGNNHWTSFHRKVAGPAHPGKPTRRQPYHRANAANANPGAVKSMLIAPARACNMPLVCFQLMAPVSCIPGCQFNR